MIKFDDIPKEMRQKRNDRCAKCSERKWHAKRLDFHFDWLDCPYNCPNDLEHLMRKMDEALERCGRPYTIALYEVVDYNEE